MAEASREPQPFRKGPASPTPPRKMASETQGAGEQPHPLLGLSRGCWLGARSPGRPPGGGGLNALVAGPHSWGSGLVPLEWRLVGHPASTCQPQGLRPVPARLPRGALSRPPTGSAYPGDPPAQAPASLSSAFLDRPWAGRASVSPQRGLPQHSAPGVPLVTPPSQTVD